MQFCREFPHIFYLVKFFLFFLAKRANRQSIGTGESRRGEARRGSQRRKRKRKTSNPTFHWSVTGKSGFWLTLGESQLLLQNVFTHNTTKLCADLKVELSAGHRVSVKHFSQVALRTLLPIARWKNKDAFKALMHTCRRLLCVWAFPPVRGGRDPLQGQVTAVFSGPKERARIPCALAVVPSSMCARRRRFRRTRSRQKNALCA